MILEERLENSEYSGQIYTISPGLGNRDSGETETINPVVGNRDSGDGNRRQSSAVAAVLRHP